MGWTQSYKFPNLFDLFRTILLEEGFPKDAEFPNKHIINLALHGLGWKIRIKKIQTIKVDEDDFLPIYGWRVILSNGNVYQTVISKRYVDKKSGNYGQDIYQWKKVKRKKSKKLKSEKNGK